MSINKEIKKMWYIYIYIYIYIYTQWNITQPKTSNKIMPFAATWMDPGIAILSEVNQRRRNIV